MGGQRVRTEGVIAPCPGKQVASERVHRIQTSGARDKGEGEGIAAKFLLHQGLGFPPGPVFVVRVFLHVQRPANTQMSDLQITRSLPWRCRVERGMKNVVSAIIQFYNLRSCPGRRVIVATHCAGAREGRVSGDNGSWRGIIS